MHRNIDASKKITSMWLATSRAVPYFNLTQNIKLNLFYNSILELIQNKPNSTTLPCKISRK